MTVYSVWTVQLHGRRSLTVRLITDVFPVIMISGSGIRPAVCEDRFR